MNPGIPPVAVSTGQENPEVTYAVGQGILKGEDVVVAHQRRLWPGSDFSALPLELALMPELPEGHALGDGDSDCDYGSAHDNGANGCDAAGAAWSPPPPGYYSFWCVFDGHNGVAAASMAAEHVTEIVEELLPYGPPEPPDSPYYQEWCEEVQRSLAEAIAALNLLFAGRGIVAGCTATLVLQVGWLVTCANVGDSRCLLDTGNQTLTLTVDHRIATHKAERRRVEATGATIAPIDFTGSGPASNVNNGVGPLRIWPGGLCLSRAVGDFDVGESVIPLPHVCQVVLPRTGGRLMVASDGVWDAFDKMTKVGTMSRSWPLETAADRMVQTITRTYGGLRDDTSIIVVDIIPKGKVFLEVVQQLGRKSNVAKSTPATTAAVGSGRGPPAVTKRHRSSGCFCFGRGAVLDDFEESPTVRADTSLADTSNPSVSVRSRLSVLANYDVAAVMGLMPETKVDPPGWYGPEVGERLLKMMTESTIVWKEAVRTGGSYHGASPGSSIHRGGFLPLAGAGSGSAQIYRAPSTLFAENVVENEEDYAFAFGHYSAKNLQPQQPSTTTGDASVRGGSGHGRGDHSTRSGRLYYDPSVRAGRMYFNADYSVRAGRQWFEGASVRAGRAFFQDQLVRTGSGHGSGGSSVGEASLRSGRGNLVASPSSAAGGAEGSTRGAGLPATPDGSVRRGGGVLRRVTSDTSSADGVPMADAEEQTQQEGAPASPSPATAKGVSWPQAEEEALGLVPIRTVRFGGVENLGPQRKEPLPHPPSGELPESGLGRRRSGGHAALAAAAAAAAASAAAAAEPPPAQTEEGGSRRGGTKAVRFAALKEDSPVDHFVGLSNSSSLLSSVDEEHVLSLGG